MPSFKHRSNKKELLDGDAIPFEDIKRNMQELDFINRKLGGHAISISGLKKIIKDLKTVPEVLHVVEIGSGGGDNLRVIKTWAAKQKIKIQLTGIDINEQCVSYARQLKSNEGIEFICSDYKDVQFKIQPHLIFSSLFCHHFTNEELIFMLQWMKENSSVGFFINDLHRNAIAYYSIKTLTKLFSKSYLVKNDAPLSVLRGFKREDWKAIFKKAGINNFNCSWRWAFRWLIIYTHATKQ